jgi:RNA polymerase sigma factor (sigma-70 family)
MRAVEATDAPPGFDAVYDDQLPAVTRLAFLLVRSQGVAEELAHDAFVRLYERFDTVENPPAFLRTVVVRLALTCLRRHRMERARLVVVSGGARHDVDEPEVDETWAAMGRLRPERRIVLVLRFYEDMTFEAIGELLGCTAATARGRVHRGLADLRKELTR